MYQANPYARYETPPLPSAPLVHPVPHQPIGQPFMSNPGLAQEENKIYSLVIDLMDLSAREVALLDLSKKREQYDDLALVLWHSFGEYFTLCHQPQLTYVA
jgi:CCR4-NOT transcription complex subunit 9